MHVSHIPGVRGQASGATESPVIGTAGFTGSSRGSAIIPATSTSHALSSPLSLPSTASSSLAAPLFDFSASLSAPNLSSSSKLVKESNALPSSRRIDSDRDREPHQRKKRARSPSSDQSEKKEAIHMHRDMGENLEESVSVVQGEGKEHRRGRNKKEGFVDLSSREEVAKLSIRDILHRTTGGEVSSSHLTRRVQKKSRRLNDDSEAAEVFDLPKAEAVGDEMPHVEPLLVPQVRIEDGRIVMAAQEVTIPAPAGVRLISKGNASHTEAPPSKLGTRGRVDKWAALETQLFYVALRQCGSDFTLIQKLFPTRTRKQIRNKFKKEERTHSRLIDYALKHPLPFDFAPFRRHVPDGESVDLLVNLIEKDHHGDDDLNKSDSD